MCLRGRRFYFVVSFCDFLVRVLIISSVSLVSFLAHSSSPFSLLLSLLLSLSLLVHFTWLPIFPSVLCLTPHFIPFEQLLRFLEELRIMAFRFIECRANLFPDRVPTFLNGGCG